MDGQGETHSIIELTSVSQASDTFQYALQPDVLLPAADEHGAPHLSLFHATPSHLHVHDQTAHQPSASQDSEVVPPAATDAKPDIFCKCELEKSGRNLVVCIDGTANQFSFKNTNVVELYSRLRKDAKQLTYYSSGIGTYVKESNWLGRVKQTVVHSWDMAVAWNLKKIILHAYKWLSDNYQAGDCIFLFGFSRGAYQVRIISGMITVVGLLHKGNDDQIAFAYELYLANIHRNSKDLSWLGQLLHNKTKHEHAMERIEKLSRQFKKTLSHKQATVHFVGVWDTVSSVGITRGPSFPETATGMTNVCGCRHALSLDERRGKFLPEHVNGGQGPGHPQSGEQRNRVKEVWFVGSHSDIGGGNYDNVELNRFGPSLRWMLYEALRYGLRVELSSQNWGEPEHKPSMTWFWRVLEVYPFRRLTYRDAASTKQWPPHLGRGRHVQERQLIHESVRAHLRNDPNYWPAAHDPEHVLGLSWSQIRDSQGPQHFIEQDADSPVIEILTRLHDAAKSGIGITPAELCPLVELTSSIRGGSQSIIDAIDKGSLNLLLNALKHTISHTDNSVDDWSNIVIARIAAALAMFPTCPETEPRYSHKTLRGWLQHASSADRERIMDVFGKKSVYEPIRGHSHAITSVVYSPDGTYIASGSWDKTLRLWDAETGDPVGEPLRGHTGAVHSVAFSPDGTFIASGSDDKTVRFWDVATQQAINPPLTGHGNTVWSVTFSPDGKNIVSGSIDHTIRKYMWDPVKRLAVGGEPFHGHMDSIYAVTFSPDGSRIASGSFDKTIRVWNAVTGEVVRVLEGHSSAVRSVVFTNNQRIVSGSSDGEIRIWDVDSRQTVLGPFPKSGDTGSQSGHTGPIEAVAASPDGKYFAACSSDQSVWLWNAATGDALHQLSGGHKDSVLSVAFSPDGRRIVSGLRNKTLLICDVVDILNSVSSDVPQTS